MSGLEPGTSWFRVEHSAATPHDQTREGGSLRRSLSDDGSPSQTACLVHTRDRCAYVWMVFSTRDRCVCLWVDSVQHQGQKPMEAIMSIEAYTKGRCIIHEVLED
ncbi:hypothetical protein Bbelb_222370 [Branchiostoma belcheri]|nr:hypothetical protein Bbelb_222370 [Branchiostoma belcheri]